MNNGRINNYSRRYCSYNGCTSDKITTNGGAISFFSFPKDIERCSLWITNSGREEFRFLTPRELNAKKLCELHFAPCMFSNKFRTNLKKSAFPMNWKKAIPELIEIDDEDENDNDHSEAEDVETTVVNGTDVEELSDDEEETQTRTPNLLNSGSTNNETNGDTNEEINGSFAQESRLVEEITNNNNSEPQVETPAITSSTTTVENTLQTPPDKSSSKSNPAPERKTKFHNLPTQATQGEFYYQQCPSVEETNHSYPEPPDGEMPLFVQQNSVASMAEEVANSETSEPPSKRRKQDKNNDLSEQMKDAMKYLKDITALLTTTEDEFELFGKSVALQLKKMSLCTALTVQAKIQQVLSQYRINDIKKKALCGAGDSNVEVNGSRDDKSEGDQEEEKQNTPQLSLDCTSETSDNEGIEDK